IDDWRRAGTCGVIACSALKRSYRDFLTGGRPEVRIVYLHGDRATMSSRLAARKEPVASTALLDHPFAILEEPEPDEDPIRLDVSRLVEDIVTELMHELGRLESRSPVDRDPGERPPRPQMKPELQQTFASIGPRPGGGKQASIGADLPLNIEDYALIG